MTNVTADRIALEYAGDPAAAMPRGHLAAEMREAREKLTASASSHYGFDLELLRLFAKGRRSSGPAMAGLGVLAAAVATTWVAVDTVLLWLALDLGALFLGSHFAGKVLAADDSTLNARRWQWKFIFTEALQGVAWAVMVWFIGQSGDSDTRSFVLVVLARRSNERDDLRLDSLHLDLCLGADDLGSSWLSYAGNWVTG